MAADPWHIQHYPVGPPTYPQSPYSTAYQKPKVGLGVVCRCPGNSFVQCLLQRRGPNSASPHKWSFPGGRLEQPGDLEDDGDVGTKRELEEECGGGIPPGLPPLIHIECCKSGKLKQTLYHVYVVDTSSNKEWEEWQPKSKNGKGTEIDTSPTELVIHGQSFPCINGYCWVDMSTLISECYELQSNSDLNVSELQHGLIRWVQNYGEHVLKTLIARSPKLPHTRRYSNSSSGSNSSNGTVRPRVDTTVKHRKYPSPRISSTGMLQPPFIPGQFVRPPPYAAPGSPTSAFYGLGLVPNPGQLSPTGSGVQTVPSHSGILFPVPSVLPPGQSIQQQQQGLIYIQPTTGMLPSSGSPSQSRESTQPPSPSIASALTTETPTTSEVLPSIASFPSTAVSISHSQDLPVHPPPIQTQLPSSQLPAGLFEQQTLGPSTTVYQEHITPSTSAQLLLSTAVHGSSGPLESEPLLPNPPSLPPASQQLISSRKEVLCRHYVAGQCPYGEKCWFAHPEPRETLSAFTPITQTRIPSSPPLHIQVPPNMWVNSPAFDLSQYVASPPQSPLDASAVRPPILPALMRPRGSFSGFPNQPPLLFLRPPIPSGRMPGNVPLLPTVPFPATIPVPADPLLKFSLLSEVLIRQDGHEGLPVADISQLAARADHFYISSASFVRDYKILFGGNRSYQNTSVLMDKANFSYNVTCLHCSGQQPSLLVVGTELGNVFIWDLKKGYHGVVTPVHIAEVVSPVTAAQVVSPVTALIHFMTSINAAQVVVTGNKSGMVSWYISQPPQKTFSLLFTTQRHAPHPVVALQILGGFLISGGQNGTVVLWSMQSQQPAIDSTIVSHNNSLVNIHVMDNSHFLTVGSGQEDDSTPSHMMSHDTPGPLPVMSLAPEGLVVSAPPGAHIQTTGQAAINSVTSDMAQLTVSEEHLNARLLPHQEPSSTLTYSINLWQFSKPPKCIKSVSNVGDICSTSFHHHPHLGSMFLAVGLKDSTVKVYNVPNFSIASELHFPEMKGTCIHVALNISRDAPLINNAFFRNPFRDLILTTVWTDAKVMICQVAKQ